MPIKVWEYQNPVWGRAFQLISRELHKHAPDWVQWVSSSDESDIDIIHIVGAGEIPLCTSKSVLVQHCYFTAGAHEHDYISLWERAKLTVSFHNLHDYTDRNFRFLHLPWGADPDIFRHENFGDRAIKVFTTGHIAETECIDKTFAACRANNSIMVHTGSNFKWMPPWYKYVPYMPENELIRVLNSAQYIPGLRLIEGFEIMCVEGLFCGARPVVPDLPTYQWYRGHAEFVDTTKDITEQLTSIFSRKPNPVTPEERLELIQKFSWKNICDKFYGEMYKSIQEDK